MPPWQAAVLTYRNRKGNRELFFCLKFCRKNPSALDGIWKRGAPFDGSGRDFVCFFRKFHTIHGRSYEVIHRLLITLCITFVSCGFSADEKNAFCTERLYFPFFLICVKRKGFFSTPLCIKNEMCCPYTEKIQGTVGKPKGYPQQLHLIFEKEM